MKISSQGYNDNDRSRLKDGTVSVVTDDTSALCSFTCNDGGFYFDKLRKAEDCETSELRAFEKWKNLESRKTENCSPKKKKKMFLIVDDSHLSRKMISKLVESQGHTFELAEDGR